MDNLLLFLDKFVEYIILVVIIVVVAALGFIVGRIIRKALDKKKAANEAIVTEETAQDK